MLLGQSRKHFRKNEDIEAKQEGHPAVGVSRSKVGVKTSGSAELSEGAGSKNRLLHVLLTWPGRVQTLAGQKAQDLRGPMGGTALVSSW